MSIFHSVLVGILQGLTEFLPISSSGHLVVIPQLFGLPPQPLVFDLILHLGTTFAILLYFYKDFIGIARAFLLPKSQFALENPDKCRMARFILIGIVPAFIGFFLSDTIEEYFRSIVFVAIFLLFGSILMLVSEYVFKRYYQQDTRDLTSKKAFLIGLIQMLALFPGVSRSGATISGGLLQGISREDSARFSFLLATPLIIGATFFKVLETNLADLMALGVSNIFAGLLASFVVGYFAIKFLLKFVKTHSLNIFIIYRVLFALFLLYFSKI